MSSSAGAIVAAMAVIGAALAPPRAEGDTAAVLRRSRQATQHGRWDAALAELRAAAQAAEGTGRPGERALLLAEQGRVALERSFYFQRDVERAEALIREALAFAETSGAERARALALLQMARLAFSQARDAGADWAVAVDYARRALQESETLGDPVEMANAVYILGLVRQMRDGHEHGVEEFERMRALAERAGDRDVLSGAERHLGYACEARKDYTCARRHYERSLALREETGALVYVPFARITLAELRWRHMGERREPIVQLERAVSEARRARSVRAEYSARLALARYLAELGRREEALRHARRALEGTRAFRATTAGRTAETLIQQLERTSSPANER
jgi:tetratricopeptide (TPR) repeat protein